MRCRFGMTWVEWCVVIVIIGILMGLLIPAVNDDRIHHRRNVCATFMKNMSLAAIQHENTRGEMPGYAIDFGTYRVSSPGSLSAAEVRSQFEVKEIESIDHRKLGTWAVALMPWLDAQPTYEHWTEDRYPILARKKASGASRSDKEALMYLALASPNLAIFQCPSNPLGDSSLGGRNSYVANTGMYHRDAGGEEEWTVTRADGELRTINFESSMRVANGVFNNKLTAVDEHATAVAQGPAVRLSDFKDGQGHTALFSENLQALPWHVLGLMEPAELITSLDEPLRYPESARYGQGMVWHYEDDNETLGAPRVMPIHRINGVRSAGREDDLYSLEMTSRNAADVARPSSAHVDGAYFGMADGGARFMTDSIDYRVYQALLTPRGSKSDVPEPTFQLADDSLAGH